MNKTPGERTLQGAVTGEFAIPNWSRQSGRVHATGSAEPKKPWPTAIRSAVIKSRVEPSPVSEPPVRTNVPASSNVSLMVDRLFRMVEAQCWEQEQTPELSVAARLKEHRFEENQHVQLESVASPEMTCEPTVPHPVSSFEKPEIRSLGKTEITKTEPAEVQPAPELPSQQFSQPSIDANIGADWEEIAELDLPISSQEMSCEPEPLRSISPTATKKANNVAKDPVMTLEPAETQQSPRSAGSKSWLAKAWHWSRKNVKVRQTKKRLKVCETVSLGDKRFVAVIQVDEEQFLVGGAAGSVAALARLESSEGFPDMLQRRWTRDLVQP